MKNLIFLGVIVVVLLSSCQERGTTTQYLSGNEDKLPPELKGLKIYNVSTGPASTVKVAVMDNQINSLTYQQGKVQESTIILNRETNQVIEVSQVLMENDTLIICRK